MGQATEDRGAAGIYQTLAVPVKLLEWSDVTECRFVRPTHGEPNDTATLAFGAEKGSENGGLISLKSRIP